jgi:SsrA-binding protein
MARDPAATRVLASNRRARFEFHILEDLECGMALTGTEVKSLRSGKCSIQEAFCMFRGGELWLLKSNIPGYSHGNIHNHEPDRDRKLLAKQRELARWDARVREKGITIVPLEMYFKGHLVKLRVALVKGKKLYDKRETQKERSARRDIDRALSRRR